MKTMTHYLTGPIVALLVIVLWPAQAQAQRGDQTYEHQHSRLDVDFPGGTLIEYVEKLHRARPNVAPNVVVMPNARALKVPPVKLVAVTVEAAVQLLEGPYVLPGGRQAHVIVQTYEIGDSADIVMKVIAEYEQALARASVWNVDDALNAGRTAEELLGAIEAVLSVFADKAEISFHPPTGLLIALGTDQQLELVGEAIDQLTYGAERRREKLESLREQIDSLEGELLRLSGRIKVEDQTVALARARLARVVDLHERGDVRSEDVAEAELEVTRADTELDVLRDQLTRVQAKLKVLGNAVKARRQPRE